MVRVRRLVLMLAASAVFAAGCGGPVPSSTLIPTAIPSATASLSATAQPTTSIIADRPIASGGSIAVLSQDGSLSVIDAGGQSVALSDPADGNFGFPTWSPDGSRIAAVRSRGSETSLVLFDATEIAAGVAVEPVVIFSKPSVEPFYLFWTPDSQAVSFLASEGGDLSLRIAPGDGSAPLDGSGRGALVRTGNPFYYDWIDQGRLVAHIGVGPKAFLGELGLDGKAVGPALGTPSDFRSPVVSTDRKSIAFVRAGETGEGNVVVAARDGSSEHAMAVFGTAAVLFDPAGNTIASIGPDEPQPAAGFPVGPVRLMDATSGTVRTLIDGRVVSFWWSPDGKTIAALGFQPAGDAGLSVSPNPSPSTSRAEVRLLFVDVASGGVRSEPVVQVSPTFVNGILAYFDQYALSHRVWAPDSSSILLPEIAADGTTHITVRFPGGEPPITLEGELAFWSP
jgi:TolB protein